MKSKCISLALGIFTISLLSFVLYTQENAPADESIIIGKQKWMKNNLDVSQFRNGDLIPEAQTAEEWKKAGTEGKPAWCYLDNDAVKNKGFGKMYNWYVVNDARGMAPKGWHIPSDKECNDLDNYLKTSKKGNDRYDRYGFPNAEGGWRLYARGKDDGKFYQAQGYWWSSESADSAAAVAMSVYDSGDNPFIVIGEKNKGMGFYVRCIMD